jgi:integrase/recombinase XerD
LDDEGVAWEYLPQVPVERVDLEISLRNHARGYTQLDHDQVDLYTEALKRADEFPAIVASKTAGRGSQKLQAVDGDAVAGAVAGPGARQNTSYVALTPACHGRLAGARDRTTRPVPPRSSSAGSWAVSEALKAVFLGSLLSPSTRRAYQYDLEDLWASCKRAGISPVGLGRADLESYFRELLEVRHLRPATVKRRLAAVRGLLRRGVEDGLLLDNAAARIRGPRDDPAPPRLLLSPQDMLALTTCAETISDRAGLLMHVLCFSGLRVSEAVNLDAGDIRPDGMAVVNGKGGRRRVVPLTPPALAMAERLRNRQGPGPLLRSRTGRRLHRSDAARLFTKIAMQALPEPVASRAHPHAARRGLASACLSGGASLQEVQRLLGHADVSTTLLYWESSRGAEPASLRTWRSATTSCHGQNNGWGYALPKLVDSERKNLAAEQFSAFAHQDQRRT